MKKRAQNSFLRGIDVSIYQGSIDWSAVAKAGVKFAIIRASHGITSDDHFSGNWTGALGAKVKRGAYHYFVPTDDVQAQVDIFLKQVGKLAPGDLAPALDLEDPAAWASIAKADRMPLVKKWLDAVEAALGIKPMIYCSLNFVGQVFDDATALGDYVLWIAYYAPDPLPTIPSVWKAWLFWQWSSKTTVDGIVGKVDGDWFNGTAADLAKLGVPAPKATPGVSTSRAKRKRKTTKKK